MLKNMMGASLMALVLVYSTVDAVDQSSYAVERFEWTAEEGCVAVGLGSARREIITGVVESDCALMTQLKGVRIDYTHAEDGTGYLVQVVSPQMGSFTCWYGADGKPVACQDQ